LVSYPPGMIIIREEMGWQKNTIMTVPCDSLYSIILYTQDWRGKRWLFPSDWTRLISTMAVLRPGGKQRHNNPPRTRARTRETESVSLPSPRAAIARKIPQQIPGPGQELGSEGRRPPGTSRPPTITVEGECGGSKPSYLILL
jgi:hypothetical protein